MASVNLSPIDLTVLSTTRSVDARTVITAGDSDAYQLTVTFSDVESISGTCQMRFVLADGTYYDRDDSDGVTVTGKAVSYMLESAFYAAAGLVCWIQFIDSNLHTQLRIGFPNIRVTGATTEASTAETYPTWAADMRELDFAIGTVETLEPGADATASITGDIPDKVLNLGIPQGDKGDAATVAVGTVTTLDAGESATVANSGTSAAAVLDFGIPKGDKGDAGEMTIGTVTTLAPGESATVTNSGTSTDAVLDIGIPAGYDGSAVPIDDASSAADRVLSAQYIKGQLSAIDADIDDLLGYIENTGLVHYIVWDTALSQCARGGASAGITTTTTNFGHFGSVNANYLNPFDQFYPWSGRKLVNVDIPTYRSVYASHGNLLDCVVAWEGDPDFELDGSNGFVGVYTPEFWGLVKLLKDGTKWFIGISSVPITGWTHYEETIGGRWFGVADGAGITSKPGLAVVNETMAAIHARATAYDMTLDDIYTWAADTMLMVVEYATMNSQTAIGKGADAVYVQGVRPYIDENAVNRVVMTDAQSANFRTGVMIDIGTSDGGYQVARRIVTSVEDYVPDSAYAIVNFDGAPIDIATTQYVSAHGTSNMLDSDILSTSGYIGTNSKCNAYYRGRVAHANYWRYCLGAYRQTGDGGIWIAGSRDAAAAVDALNTGIHTNTGFVLPEASNYIASLHLLASGLYPFAKTTGGSGGSANPVGDYCYVPSLATEATVLRLGGYAYLGVFCGRFFSYWSYSAAVPSWSFSGLPFLKTP